jgi:hypothetical protein
MNFNEMNIHLRSWISTLRLHPRLRGKYPFMTALTPLAASRCCFRISGDEMEAEYKRTQSIESNAARNVGQYYR